MNWLWELTLAVLLGVNIGAWLICWSLGGWYERTDS